MKDAYFAVNSINGENLPVPEIIDLAEGIKVLQGSFYVGDESCPLTIEF